MTKPKSRSVLRFHGIGNPVSKLEDGEDNYWIAWDFFDLIVEYCSALDPQNDRFTFDDGNESDLEAARRMRAHGVDGHFFVLVGRIGRPGYLSADNIRELVSLGMEIGLHGRDHLDWREVDDATLVSEVDLAADELSTICGRRISTLAVPFGAYDRRVWRYLAQTDLSRIYTCDPGVSPVGSRFVRRNAVMKGQAFTHVAAMLHDQVSPYARLRRAVMPLIKRSI